MPRDIAYAANPAVLKANFPPRALGPEGSIEAITVARGPSP